VTKCAFLKEEFLFCMQSFTVIPTNSQKTEAFVVRRKQRCLLWHLSFLLYLFRWPQILRRYIGWSWNSENSYGGLWQNVNCQWVQSNIF